MHGPYYYDMFCRNLMQITSTLLHKYNIVEKMELEPKLKTHPLPSLRYDTAS